MIDYLKLICFNFKKIFYTIVITYDSFVQTWLNNACRIKITSFGEFLFYSISKKLSPLLNLSAIMERFMITGTRTTKSQEFGEAELQF